MAETLEFEEPIAVFLKEIDALAAMPRTDARDREIDVLRRRIESVRGELYARLTPWQRVLVARHPSRPGLEDFIQRLFPGFVEIHGDRRFADDHAIMTGFAEYHDQPVLLVGHVKGRDTKEKIYRNFGYARPEGYRKAMRAIRMTETPIIVIVSGEGGSGGALGIAIGDRVFMQEYAIYSVIPPEGCAALVWRDASKKAEAAEALKLTAPDLFSFGIIDDIIREPIGGAHTDHDAAAAYVDEVLTRELAQVSALDTDTRLNKRYEKFRSMGRLGIEFIDNAS